MLEGYSGMFLFIALFLLSNFNKPITFVVCMILGALIVTGRI